MARRGRRRGGLHAAVGRKRTATAAAAAAVASPEEDVVQESDPEEQQPEDEPSCSAVEDVDEEPEVVLPLEPETSSFLSAMERDTLVKTGREFELPFKKDELKRLEVRHADDRAWPWGCATDRILL